MRLVSGPTIGTLSRMRSNVRRPPSVFSQALNPRLAQRLMAALCSWTQRLNGDRQWLLTAHNPAILDGIPLNNPEIRLFTVDRDSKGHTVVKRIDLEAALKARPNEEWTLSRMWMNGLLGGVPNV